MTIGAIAGLGRQALAFPAMTAEWLPGPVARLDRARATLPVVLDRWLGFDELALAQLGVWQLTLGPDSVWARMPGVLRETADAVARWSETMRTGRGARGDERLLAQNASRRIDGLAAWVLIDLGLPVDRAPVLAEADSYVEEVNAEDDGLLHATDAISALLDAHLAGRERPLSQHELEHHAVEILAPLLAQAACLNWDDSGA